MRLFPYLLVGSLFLALGCSAPSSENAPVDSNDSAISSYDAMMKSACLATLPAELEAEGPALSDAQAQELSSESELARGFIEVAYASCSTSDYAWGAVPSCSRIYSREAIDPNWAPPQAVREGRSYRHVVASMSNGALALTTTSSVGSPPSFEVSGGFDAVTATMKPGGSSTLPEDLAMLDGYSKLELHGRMTEHELVLTRTEGPTVIWNWVSCGRAALRMTF